MPRRPTVCIPSFSVAPESDQEDTLSEGKGNPGGSLVAPEAMVFVPASHVDTSTVSHQSLTDFT